MEIRGIDGLGLACVNPQLFKEGLAIGTVTVAAGIVVVFHMAAFRAGGDAASQSAGLAGHEGIGSFLLYRGRAEGRGI